MSSVKATLDAKLRPRVAAGGTEANNWPGMPSRWEGNKPRVYEPVEELSENCQGPNCAYEELYRRNLDLTIFTQLLLGLIASQVTYVGLLQKGESPKIYQMKRGLEQKNPRCNIHNVYIPQAISIFEHETVCPQLGL